MSSNKSGKIFLASESSSKSKSSNSSSSNYVKPLTKSPSASSLSFQRLIQSEISSKSVSSSSSQRGKLRESFGGSMRQSRKFKHDPWNDSTVWAFHNNKWEPARVISNTRPVPPDNEWTFVVEILPQSRHPIKTKSIDELSTMEFEHIKRRDSSINYVEISDMTRLSFLNEPEMLQCLKKRYEKDFIYTNTGPILIAINPYKKLNIYSEESLRRYYEPNNANAIKVPHIYQISHNAYQRMFVDRFDPDKRENQAILVNGESGSGKTESTKYILHYLAQVSAAVSGNVNPTTSSGDIESQVIASNPITESFGNAKTSRNDNSSRFGKYIELLYTADGYIEGAKIRTYLLETVRVVRQSPGDRNFHIFYEIFAGLEKQFRRKMRFERLEDFNYMNQSGQYTRDDNVSDLENYNTLLDAFSTIRISQDYQDEILRILVGILHLGNLEFDTDVVNGIDVSKFSKTCKAAVDMACELLGLTKQILEHAVTIRSLSTVGGEVLKNLDAVGASYARDALAKTIFDKLFKWIVLQVNISLSGGSMNPETEAASSIGVLDIFGFEHFKENTFEQLCINYTNEKLQDHFNFSIFKSEQEVYVSEGLQWKFVHYPDNFERLDLLENRTFGIFALCDEQLKIPKASDDKLAITLYERCSKHRYFSAKGSEKVNYEFTFHHYACPVKYSCIGFLDKNRSEVAKEIQDCLLASSNELLNLTGEAPLTYTLPRDKSPGGGGGSGAKSRSRIGNNPYQVAAQRNSASRVTGKTVGKKMTTVSSEFVKELDSLMLKIKAKRSHFVRCIKPNDYRAKSNFDSHIVLDQLKHGGVLGAIQVFRAGFPNRMDFTSFVNRYLVLSYASGVNALTKDLFDLVDEARRTAYESYWVLSAGKLVQIVPLAAMVLQIIDYEEGGPSMSDVQEGLQMGKTQILMKAQMFEFLERMQERSFNLIALRLLVRHRARKVVAAEGSRTPFKTRRGKSLAQHAMMLFADSKRFRAITKVRATILLQRRARVFLAVTRRKKIIKGIKKLQARWRGYKGRKAAYVVLNKKVATMQSVVRMFLLRRRFKREKAAIKIQKHIRGYLVRKGGESKSGNHGAKSFMSAARQQAVRYSRHVICLNIYFINFVSSMCVGKIRNCWRGKIADAFSERSTCPPIPSSIRYGTRSE